MKRKFNVDWKSKWYIYYAMLFFLAVGFGYFHYNWVFAIKPFIIMTAIGTLVSLFLLKSMKPLLGFEKYMLLFWFIYIIACIRFYNLKNGIRYICGSILIIAFYFCVRMALERVTIQQLEGIISYSGIILCLASLISYVWGLYLVDFHFSNIVRLRTGGILIEHSIPRLYGVFDRDPNIAAFMTMLYLVYYVTHLEGTRNYVGIVLSTVCFLLTFSRSALLSLFVGVIVGRAVPYYRRRPIRFRKINLFVAVFLVLLLVFLRIQGFDWWSLIKHRFSLLSFDRGTGRFDLYEYGIKGWTDFPVFGIGGNYTKIYMQQFFYEEKVLHNTWLEILLETGIVGIIPCICFLWKLFQCIMAVGSEKPRYLVILMTAMVIMMASLSVQFNPAFYLVVALVYRYMLEKEEVRRNGKCYIH